MDTVNCTGRGWVKKKYTRLMNHNTAAIASLLQIRLGLDS